MTTTSHAPATAPVEATGNGRDRIRLVAGALAVSALTLAVLLITHPWGERLDSGADEVLSYSGLPADPDLAWTAMLIDVFGYAVLSVCLALGTCHLVRTRGRAAATVGSVLTVVGGILFAMGGLAFATLTWFAAELPEESGRDLVNVANDELGHLMGAQMAGFLLITLGSLILAGALIRARAVPRLAVAVFVVLTVGLFAGLPGTLMNVLQAGQILVAGGLAIPLWRRAGQ